jgi:hypothetical protein
LFTLACILSLFVLYTIKLRCQPQPVCFVSFPFSFSFSFSFHSTSASDARATLASGHAQAPSAARRFASHISLCSGRQPCCRNPTLILSVYTNAPGWQLARDAFHTKLKGSFNLREFHEFHATQALAHTHTHASFTFSNLCFNIHSTSPGTDKVCADE